MVSQVVFYDISFEIHKRGDQMIQIALIVVELFIYDDMRCGSDPRYILRHAG